VCAGLCFLLRASFIFFYPRNRFIISADLKLVQIVKQKKKKEEENLHKIVLLLFSPTSQQVVKKRKRKNHKAELYCYINSYSRNNLPLRLNFFIFLFFWQLVVCQLIELSSRASIKENKRNKKKFHLILIFFDDFFPRKKKNIKILTATVTKSLL
jgi:hypothetical protein